MDLDATFGAVVAVFKVLDDAAFTKGVQALCHRGGLDQVSFTHVACDKVVEILDQVLSR